MKAIKLRAIFTFISIFLFSFNSYSQTLSTYDSRINYFWDFYSNNRLSVINAGKGCTGIAGENEISGVLLNPASLNINKKFQLHAEYVYKTNVTWLPSSEGDNPRLKQFNPAFMISGAYRFNNYLQTGLMFYSSIQ